MSNPTKQLCNCLPNECHAAPGWTCRKKALTSNQCGVKGCKNTRDSGAFVGPFCAPCDQDLRTGNFQFGTSVVYEQAREIERLRAALRSIGEHNHPAVKDDGTRLLWQAGCPACNPRSTAEAALSANPSAPETTLNTSPHCKTCECLQANEPQEYSLDFALSIARLWRAGKMIGGDEDAVIFALLAELERRDSPVETKGDSQ